MGSDPQPPYNPLIEMNETWLKSNQRLIVAGLVISALMVVIGLSTIAMAFRENTAVWAILCGGGLAAAGTTFFAVATFQLRQPRVGYRNGNILFFLRSGSPIVVPLEIVEAFFLGQGDTHLSGKAGRSKTVNLVARIGERFTEWQRVDVQHQLASWCDGYVTIRGTWTEPLNEKVVRAINHKLAEAKRDCAGR